MNTRGSKSLGESSKNPDGIKMVSLDYVSRLIWNEELGTKLKLWRLKGKISRQKLSDKLKDAGITCSPQYLRKLEDGQAESISVELLLGICQILKISLGKFVPLLSIEQPD